MNFEILLFYKDESAVTKYLSAFRFLDLKPIRCSYNEMVFGNQNMRIRCIRGLSQNIRGYKAHIIGIQEELTWRENWPEIRDCVLRPTLMSPIDIQIFDGVSKEEAEWVEDRRTIAA